MCIKIVSIAVLVSAICLLILFNPGPGPSLPVFVSMIFSIRISREAYISTGVCVSVSHSLNVSAVLSLEVCEGSSLYPFPNFGSLFGSHWNLRMQAVSQKSVETVRRMIGGAVAVVDAASRSMSRPSRPDALRPWVVLVWRLPV